MAKKGGKSSKVPHKGEKTKPVIEQALIENFVSLQRVLTNLSIKFEALSDNISKLLQLFEISARSFVEKLPEKIGDGKEDKDLLEKIDKLVDQNKTIAKGLTLMEEKLRGRVYGGIDLESRKERPRYPGN